MNTKGCLCAGASWIDCFSINASWFSTRHTHSHSASFWEPCKSQYGIHSFTIKVSFYLVVFFLCFPLWYPTDDRFVPAKKSISFYLHQIYNWSHHDRYYFTIHSSQRFESTQFKIVSFKEKLFALFIRRTKWTRSEVGEALNVLPKRDQTHYLFNHQMYVVCSTKNSITSGC